MERIWNSGGIDWEQALDYNGGAFFASNNEFKIFYMMEVRIMYLEAIAEIIAERTGCDASTVKPENTFAELGIDSLDTVELLMNLEDKLGIEIELDGKVETVGDLDAFLQRKAQG